MAQYAAIPYRVGRDEITSIVDMKSLNKSHTISAAPPSLPPPLRPGGMAPRPLRGERPAMLAEAREGEATAVAAMAVAEVVAMVAVVQVCLHVSRVHASSNVSSNLDTGQNSCTVRTHL